VGLKERHPEAFQEARAYEKQSTDNGSLFTWSEGETLDELTSPERTMQIKKDHEDRLARAKKNRVVNPLRSKVCEPDLDELYGKSKVCLACHK
jgi:hypothetical protein